MHKILRIRIYRNNTFFHKLRGLMSCLQFCTVCVFFLQEKFWCWWDNSFTYFLAGAKTSVIQQKHCKTTRIRKIVLALIHIKIIKRNKYIVDIYLVCIPFFVRNILMLRQSIHFVFWTKSRKAVNFPQTWNENALICLSLEWLRSYYIV